MRTVARFPVFSLDILPVVAALVVCANVGGTTATQLPQPDLESVDITGGNGISCDVAIKIENAKSVDQVWSAERDWIANKFPNALLAAGTCERADGKTYHVIKFFDFQARVPINRPPPKSAVCFDVTDALPTGVFVPPPQIGHPGSVGLPKPVNKYYSLEWDTESQDSEIAIDLLVDSVVDALHVIDLFGDGFPQECCVYSERIDHHSQRNIQRNICESCSKWGNASDGFLLNDSGAFVELSFHSHWDARPADVEVVLVPPGLDDRLAEESRHEFPRIKMLAPEVPFNQASQFWHAVHGGLTSAGATTWQSKD